MPAPIVLVRRLCKSYNGVQALSDLNLTLNKGEILGLLGSNGAGKTTAIHILCGLLTPSSGEVSIFGLSPLTKRHEIAPRINFSSAYVHMPSNLKVIENMTLFARLYNVAQSRQKIQYLLELLGMASLQNRLTGALSSGERTRLNLARALLNDPELLLLDEPTASLDPEMGAHVGKILKNIRKERRIGIVYTSHNMPEVQKLCDRILFLHKGRAIAEGKPEEVLAQFKTNSLDQLFIKIVRGGDVVTAGDDF